jgi:D-inositol-3-phosphate glycosyltransferase
VAAVLALPDTFDGYLEAIGKKQRHEVRRKRRRYEETVGELHYESHHADGYAFDEFVRLHRRSTGSKGRFMTPEHEEFFRCLITTPGWRLDILRIPGSERAAACLFVFVDETGMYLYNSAYDPDLAEASPGRGHPGCGHRAGDHRAASPLRLPQGRRDLQVPARRHRTTPLPGDGVIVIRRVAYLSMHTSPLLQPGFGDAGGMNVYIDELSRTMAQRGVEVDVFTRRDDPSLAKVVEVGPGYRVHHVDAGPAKPLPVARLARHVRQYADGVVASVRDESTKPDIIHSHYWLSGWAGLIVKRCLEVPLANSFHTLGRVKDLTRRHDEPPESLLRIAAEHEVIEGSDCVVASTPLEAEDLMDHYGADPPACALRHPASTTPSSAPAIESEARRRLGLGEGPLLLFVGRIQPLKGVDVAVDTLAAVRSTLPDTHMVIIGGPSGPAGADEYAAIVDRIERLGLTDAVTMVAPVPHVDLAVHYRAADALVLPSRSESFGLVAAEAQACGLPVVATRVGGLVHVVSHERSGLLVDGWDPADHAEAVLSIIVRPDGPSPVLPGGNRVVGAVLVGQPPPTGSSSSTRVRSNVPARDTLVALIDAWVADPDGDVVYAEEVEGRWATRLRQECREATTIWWDVGSAPSPPRRMCFRPPPITTPRSTGCA